VDIATADKTVLTNKVTLEYTDANGQTPYPTQSDTATTTVTAPVMTVEKKVSSAKADPGDALEYTIIYKNTGTGVAAHVWINDTIPADTTFVTSNPGYTSYSGDTYTWHLTNIKPGTYFIKIIVRVDTATPDKTILLNKVTLEYTDANGQTPYATQSDTATTTVTAPVMTIEKKVDEVKADPGDILEYTITYKNTGTGVAAHVWINDTIPADTTFVSSSPAYTTVSGDTYTWHIKNVGTGTYTITIKVRVDTATPDQTILKNKVTLEYTDANGQTPYATQYASATTTVTAPIMTVEKKADLAKANPGDIIEYTITYKNTGTGVAAHVWINDTIPADTTFVSSSINYTSVSGDTYTWHLTNIGTGTYTITIKVRVDTATPDKTILTNKVTLEYTDANGQTPYATQSDTATTTVTAPVMTVEKKADLSKANPGDIIEYTITYNNTGTGVAAHVWINDTIPWYTTFVSSIPAYTSVSGSTYTWHLTNKGTGTYTISVKVRVNIATPDKTVLTNKVTLEYTDANGQTPYATESDSATTIVTAPDMSVEKKADSPVADPGDIIKYTITYKNTGTGVAAHVWINDTIPADTTFVSSSLNYTSVSGDTYTWHLTNIGTGTYTITIKVRVDIATPDKTILLNKVTLEYTDANGQTPYGTQVDTATTTVTAPVMTVEKKVNAANADPGDILEYTITYRNTGTGVAAHVWINDTIPVDTTFVSSTPTYTSVSGDTYTWHITNVKTGTYVIKIKVRVDTATPDKTVLTNKVTLEYTDANGQTPYATQSDTATTTVTAPVMTIEKKVDLLKANPGDILEYTITYHNTGTGVAAHVWINDTIPADTTFVSSSLNYTSVSGDTYTWHLTNIGTGTNTITIKVRIDTATPDQTILKNKVTLEYTDANGQTPYATQSATATTTVTAPVMTVEKKADLAKANPGDIIEYTITYKNTGTGVSAHVWINDTIPADTTFVSSSPAYTTVSGDTYTWHIKNVGTGTYTITIKVRVDIATPDKTVLTNKVTLEYTDANGQTPYPTQSDSATTIVTAPVMTVEKKADYATVDPDDTITYTITYKNTGTGTAGHVWINDTIPYYTTFVSSSINYTSVSGDTYTWHITNVPTGTYHIILKVKVDVATPDKTILTNKVTLEYTDANGQTPYATQNDSVTSTVTAPILNIEKDPNDSTADPGDTITYTIKYSNTGTGNASNIYINDTLPMYTSYVSSTPTYTLKTGSTYTWHFTNVAPGNYSITLKVKVKIGTPDKTILVNLVTMDYSDANNNYYPRLNDTALVTVTAPVMTVQKIVSSAKADPGDFLQYTIIYKNTGTGVAAHVWINDTIPADTTFVTSNPAYSSVSGDTYTWHRTNVGTGTYFIKIIVRVDTATPDKTILLNKVTLEYTDANGQTPYATQSDTATTTVTAPVMTVEKKVDEVKADPGDILEYTITYKNTGTGVAAHVWINDTIPADTTFVWSSKAYTSVSGDTYTWHLTNIGTGTYTITIKVRVDIATPDKTILTNKVTLEYTDANGQTPYATQSDTATTTVTAPDMTVEKKANLAKANPGDIIEYTITYKNTGTGDAGHVWINDTIPADTTFVSSSPGYYSVSGDTYTWHLTNIGTGTYTITIKVRVDIATPDKTVLVNKVTLEYTDANGQTPYPTQSDSVNVTVTAPIMTVEKKVDEAKADPGDILKYTITYKNTGTGVAAHVWINDTIPADTTFVSSNPAYTSYSGDTYTWHLTNKGTGTYTITIKVRVDIATPDKTILLNKVTLEYTDANGQTPYPTLSDTATTTVTAPVMTVEKKVDETKADPGDILEYTITYKNTGTGVAAHVWINDTIPADTTFVSSSINYTSVSGDTYTWHLTNIGTGTYTITIKVRVDVGTPDKTILLNKVTLEYTDANGQTPYPTLSDTATTTVTAPVMTVEKKVDQAKADPGDVIEYTITYKNTGTGVAAHVWINDTIPADTTFVSSSPGYFSVSGDTYTWHFTNVVTGIYTIKIKVRVDIGTPDKTILLNKVTLEYTDANGQTPYPTLSDTATTTVTAPVMTVEKKVDEAKADPGDILEYTITYKNTGTGVAAHVWINDTIPADTTFLSSSLGYYAVSGDTYTWHLLNVGTGTYTLTIKVRVDTATPDKTILKNKVTLEYTDANGQTPYPTQSDSATTIVTAPILTVEKKADLAKANPGDTIEYTITYKNTGTGVAAHVWINDTIPADTTIDPSSTGYYSVSGDTYTYHFTNVGTGTYTITIKVKVDAYTPDKKVLVNKVTLEYTDANGQTPYPTLVDYANVTVTAPVITLTKVADKTLADPGDIIEYTITVKNTGTGVAGTVWIVDTIPADTTFKSSSPTYTTYSGDTYTWKLTNFGTGTYVISIKVKVDVGTPDRTVLTNSVEVKYTDANGNVYPTLTDSAVTIVTAPDMSITKDGPKIVTPGQTFIYYINYTNSGSGWATNVVIKDILPANVIFLSSTPAPTSTSGNTITWVFPTVKGYTSGSIMVTVQLKLFVKDGIKLINTVYLNYQDNNSNQYDEEKDYTETLVVAGSIGDYVWYDKDMEGDQDEVNAGIANVKIILTGTTIFSQAIDVTTYTNSNGYYLFNGLPPGSYVITAYPTGSWIATTPNPVTHNLTLGEDFLDADFGLAKFEIDKSVKPTQGANDVIVTVTLVVKNPTNNADVTDVIPTELAYTGDTLDNDFDGRIDEEAKDWIDNDGDGLIDEDLGNFQLDGSPITGGLTLSGNKLTYSGLTRGVHTIVFDLIIVEKALEEHTVTNLAQVLYQGDVKAEDTADIHILVYWFNKTYVGIGIGIPGVDDDHDGIIDEWGEGDFIDYGDQDGIIEVGELILWLVEYNITNPFNYTMTNVKMEDRWGGEYGLGGDGDDNDNDGLIDEELFNGIDDDGDGDIDEDVSDFYKSKGTETFVFRGATDKIYITWNIGTLLPGETAVMRMPVFTDRNTGVNKKSPKGHQEYTSPGHYILNSGAVVKWLDDRDKQHSAHTDVLHADAYDSSIGNNTNKSVPYNSLSGYIPTGKTITMNEGEEQTFKVKLGKLKGTNVLVMFYLDGTLVSTDPKYTYSPDYYSAGEHEVKVEVFDKNFYPLMVELEGIHHPYIWKVIVNDYNTAPQAVITSPEDNAQIDVDVEIEFSGEDSTDGESVLTYHWDFGDGTESDEMNTNHVYDTPGDYTVSLTVTDHDGWTDTAKGRSQGRTPQ
jgi:uncharacterized repeat protein (TIGR01451 family)